MEPMSCWEDETSSRLRGTQGGVQRRTVPGKLHDAGGVQEWREALRATRALGWQQDRMKNLALPGNGQELSVFSDLLYLLEGFVHVRLDTGMQMGLEDST
ncbi:hypothetical protein STEG23_011210, partial [Scotinomys teguina]